MFRKLRIQLILLNVISLSIVLSLVFTGIYGLLYTGMNRQSEAIMKTIAYDEKIISVFENTDMKAGFKGGYFIRLDPLNQVIDRSSNFDYQKTDTEHIIYEALNQQTVTGLLDYKDTQFRYYLESKPYGSILVLLDNGVQAFVLRSLIIAFMIVGSVSLTFVCIISLFLANKAIKPVKKSLNDQKEFIADASHELRTPLAVITSSLEIVMENDVETVAMQKKWLDNIKSELQRMEQLIGNLLFLARADANADEGEYGQMDTFSLMDLSFQTLELFKPLTDKKDIHLTLDCLDASMLYGNAFKIRQLLDILMDNAIKHTPQNGWITLKIETAPGSVLITVSDSGEGIPKESIPQVFDRFYRVDKSRSRNNGGSGLGLSIAKSIVDSHKGKISVKSELGHGTIFTVSLPSAL